ncbi:YraN family protein [bacterium]|nr:YraN family protein [bacterium]
MNRKTIGILGEKIAVEYLRQKGYKILERNYSPKFVSGPMYGEIDIVAKKGDILSFVEVKTQVCKSGEVRNFFPEDRVNYSKQRKIIKTSKTYLLENNLTSETKWQIDILAIGIFLKEKKAKIRHIKNAVSDFT